MDTVADLSKQLAEGEVTSLALTSAALDRILDTAGEGARVFTMIDPERSFAQAQRHDTLHAQGASPSPLSGISVSIKNLFDISGRVTIAGSQVLAQAAPATADAAVVARLRKAGMVIMGHTNMTEFAYSGLGLNPHYGTPANPVDRRRIPGGSSSGAAVSVADGMAAVGLGTDTGGSCRIPAAFCGLTGFKPTARRIPMDGTFPLSSSFDSIGSVARSVTCCEMVDAVLSAESGPMLTAPDLSELRFAVLDNFVLDDLTPAVAAAFEAGLKTLVQAGAQVARVRLDDLDALPALNARGGIIAAEAFAVHQKMLAKSEAAYDPRVSARIRKAETQHPGEYQDLLETRRQMIARADIATAPFDALLMPTVAMEAPTLAEMADDAAFGAANLLALRNTTVANLLDRCAISLPLPVDGLPVGLMLMGETMDDRRLFAMARSVEQVLRR
ncbi:amidase [Rhodobacteraceae bacterium D3-12]|nr:amidase [Rhodobacteraceae bacterium D3-12]